MWGVVTNLAFCLLAVLVWSVKADDSKTTCHECTAAGKGYYMVIQSENVVTRCGSCSTVMKPGVEWKVCAKTAEDCDTIIVDPGVADPTRLQEAPNTFSWKDDKQCFEITDCAECKSMDRCSWRKWDSYHGCINNDVAHANGALVSGCSCQDCAKGKGFSMAMTKDGVKTACGNCAALWHPGKEWVLCLHDPNKCDTDIKDPGVEDPTNIQEAPNTFNWKDDKQCFEITNCKECMSMDRCSWRKWNSYHGCVNKDVADLGSAAEGTCTCPDCARDTGFSMTITKDSVKTDCEQCTESHIPGKEWVVCVTDPGQCNAQIVDPGVKDYSNLKEKSPHTFDWKDDQQCFEIDDCNKCRKQSGCKWAQSGDDVGCISSNYPGAEDLAEGPACKTTCHECTAAGSGFYMIMYKEHVITGCGYCTLVTRPGEEWKVCANTPDECDTYIVDPGVEDPTQIQEAPNTLNYKDGDQCFEITNCKKCKENDRCAWRKYMDWHGCINKDVFAAKSSVDGTCTCPDCARDTGFSMTITKDSVKTECEQCTESHIPGKEWVVCVTDPEQCNAEIVDPGVKDNSKLKELSPHTFDWKDDQQCFEIDSCSKCRTQPGCKWAQSEGDVGCIRGDYPGADDFPEGPPCTSGTCSECAALGGFSMTMSKDGVMTGCGDCSDSWATETHWVVCVKDPELCDVAITDPGVKDPTHLQEAPNTFNWKDDSQWVAHVHV